MSMSHARTLLLPALFALALFALAACKRDPEDGAAAPAVSGAPARPDAGGVVPDEVGAEPSGSVPADVLSLRLPTLDGGQFDLAEHRGQWVLVNYWATWCSPCLKEMPELSALDAMREHISVIGLAMEDISADEMRAFLEKHPVVYPIAIVGLEQALPGFDAPVGLPMTYLVGPDGRMAKRYAGVLTAEKVEADIAELGGPTPGA